MVILQVPVRHNAGVQVARCVALLDASSNSGVIGNAVDRVDLLIAKQVFEDIYTCIFCVPSITFNKFTAAAYNAYKSYSSIVLELELC